jgi:hypothetical protein
VTAQTVGFGLKSPTSLPKTLSKSCDWDNSFSLAKAFRKSAFSGLLKPVRKIPPFVCAMGPETQLEKQSPENDCLNGFPHCIIVAMKVGYARVSTHEQNLSLQVDALKQAGCEEIYRDQVSGAKAERSGLQDALAYLRQGDTFVVWRLDRLGRSLKHLIEIVTMLEERGIGFRSLQESIDTTTSGGRLVFHIFGALAEFE